MENPPENFAKYQQRFFRAVLILGVLTMVAVAVMPFIDILSMLEEKTRGNLDVDEAGMLKNILYDLRIQYVKEKG